MRHSNISDMELLLSLSQGAAMDLQDELYVRYQPLAYKTALRVLHNPIDADDVAQTTLLALIDYCPKLHSDGSLTGLVIRMAQRSALHLLRGEERRRSREVYWCFSHHSFTEGVPETIERREVHSKLKKALKQLPDIYRLPIELHFFKGLSTPEVARELRISNAAARTRLSRAYARLRNDWAGAEGHGGWAGWAGRTIRLLCRQSSVRLTIQRFTAAAWEAAI